MAIEFNVTTANKFFLGEDKVIEVQIFEQNGITPLDISAIPLRWDLRKTDKAADPALLTKSIDAGGASTTGVTIVGIFSATPASNTQRLRLTFISNETDPVVTAVATVPYKLKANVVYRHSLKRMDTNNEGVLFYGSFTFLQSTVR